MIINPRRFTDDEYLAKKEIESKVQPSEIETVWRSVTDYREKYRYVVNIRKNELIPFSLCLTPSILTYCTVSERRLASFALKFTELSVKEDLSSDKQLTLFNKQAIKEDLVEIAKHYNIKVNDNDIDLIMSTSFDSTNPISNFYKAYNYLLEGSRPFDLETILELFAQITGSNEIHFRKDDKLDGTATFRIHDFIESMISYVNNHQEYSVFAVAPIVYSYILYVKPFEQYNTFLAALLSLKVIKDAGYGNCIFYTKLVKNLIEDEKRFQKAFENTKFYGDFTYVMIEYAQVFIDTIEEELAKLNTINIIPNITTQIKIVEKIVEVPVKEEVTPMFKEYVQPEETKEEVDYSSIDDFALEEETLAPVPVTPAPAVAPVTPAPVVAPKPEIAEKIFIDAMDLRETAKKHLDDGEEVLASALLETNPMMKQYQAHFYASHHEVGRYYTISQFKEFADCAYETARTSMDYLTACKLYKKEQVKNKFVYKAEEI